MRDCKRLLLLAAASMLVASTSPVHALYGSDSKVKLLTARNFQSAVIDSDVPAMVEFFAPWCGHCQQLSPIYSRVAENLHGIVTIGAVDCDVDSNKGLCGQYGIQGFPTLKLFPASKRKNTKTGKLTKTPEDYNGPRGAKAIADAATAGLTDVFIQRPSTQAAFDKFRAGSKLAKVVLVTDKKTTSTLYKSLSMRFRDRLSFAELRDPNGAVAQGLGVDAPPTLFVLPVDEDTVTYQGKLKAKDLVEFLKPFAGSKGGGDSAASASSDKASGTTGGGKDAKAEAPLSVEDQSIALSDLQLSDVDSALESDAVWLLASFQGAEGNECSAKAIELAQAAHALGSLAKVGRINVTGLSDGELAERGLGAPPAGAACQHVLSLKAFGEQSEPEETFPVFQGNVSASKEVQAFVLGGFPTTAVVSVSERNLEPFIGAGQGMKVILFTNKEETPLVFAALAANTQLEADASFGTVHERETGVLEKFKVKKVPTMLVAWAEEMEQKDEQGRPLMGARLQPYQGPFKYERMVDFLRLLAAVIADKRDGGEGVIAPPGAPMKQANTTEDWQSMCASKTDLCVVGMLNPGMGDHPERVAHLSLQALKRQGQQVSFLWVDLRQQPEFAKAFNVSLKDAPTAVVLSPRKRRYAALPEGLDGGAHNLDRMVDRLRAGKQRTVPLQVEIPPFVEVAPSEATPGEGAAAGAQEAPQQEEEVPAESEEALEDEFDLADLMAEETGAAAKSKADRLAEVDAQIQREAEERRKQEEEAAEAERKAKAKAAAKAAAEARKERQRKREAAAAAATAAAAEAAGDEL